MQSERNQSQKTNYDESNLYDILEKRKTIEMQKRTDQ